MLIIRKFLKACAARVHFGVRLLLRIFEKKTPKRTWLCAGISPLLYGLRTRSKRQKTRQVF